MSFIDRLIGFPNTLLQLIQACTDHLGEVVDVWDPNGRGAARLKIVSIGGADSKTNWVVSSNSNAGPNKEGASPSGLWNPPRIGERQFCSFPGGKVTQLNARSAGVGLPQKGDPGTRRA